MTVLTYLSMVAHAAEAIERTGIDAELIDLRFLDRASLDWETVGESVRKTNAVLIVEQGALGTSYGGWLADEVQRRFFDWLDQPVQRVHRRRGVPVDLEGAGAGRDREDRGGRRRARTGPRRVREGCGLMATVVRMPTVLAGATEAAIAHWLVAPGDTVAVGMPIAEIETEKALVEYAAEEAGVVGRLVLGEGDTGEIGDPIAVLVAAGETDADIDAALGGPGTPATARRPRVAGARRRAWPRPVARAGVQSRRRRAGDERAPGPGGRRADLRQPARAQARRRAGHRPRGAGRDRAERADRPARPGAVPRRGEPPFRQARAAPARLAASVAAGAAPGPAARR